MRQIFYVFMAVIAIFMTACGQDTYVVNDDQNDFVAHGTVEGQLGELDAFNTSSNDIRVVDSEWGSYVDFFVEIPDLRDNADENDVVVIMSRIALVQGVKLQDLEPGVYRDVGDSNFYGMACYGAEKGIWEFDATARDATVVVSDVSGIRVFDYDYHFESPSAGVGDLTGTIKIPGK